jgi:hypothetical protein
MRRRVSFPNIQKKYQEMFGKLAPCMSDMKAMAAKDVWKAIPSKLQLAYKHPVTGGKLTLIPSTHGEDEGIIKNKISELICFFEVLFIYVKGCDLYWFKPIH